MFTISPNIVHVKMDQQRDIMAKGSIPRECAAITNKYASNFSMTKYMKQPLQGWREKQMQYNDRFQRPTSDDGKSIRTRSN